MGNMNDRAPLHESFRPCRDMLLALTLIFGLSTYLYGVRVLIIVAISVLTALLCDLLAAAMRGTGWEASDISSYVFALTLAAMLPASVSYLTAAYAVAVAVLLGKHVFGGWSGLVFHPAALGYAVAAVGSPADVLKYPAPFKTLGLGLSAGDVQLYDGVSTTLRLKAVPNTDIVDLIMGRYAAPMGTAFTLVIIASLVLFIAHSAVTRHVPIAFLTVCAAWSVIAPRLPVTRRLSLEYEMSAGGLLFAAVFILPLPAIAPKNPRAKIAYGVIAALAAIAFRTMTSYELGVCFASLLTTPLAAWLDAVAGWFEARHAERQPAGKKMKGGEADG